MNFISHIEKEQISTLPLRAFSGEIKLIDRFEQVKYIAKELSKARFLGFDTETRPSFKKGAHNQHSVALLQLSTEETAYLIRLNKIGLPPAIRDVLANPEIPKIGVAIHDDIIQLRRLTNFEPGGFIDLQKFTNQFGIEDSGLKKLAAIVLQIRISKNQQLTNWEDDELSESQQLYAATDAWVCAAIYKKLLESR